MTYHHGDSLFGTRYTMESSDSDVECGALFGQIRPYQLEPYAARRPEGEEVAAGVDVVRVGNTDW